MPEDEGDLYAGLPENHCARFDGIPGLVWYSSVRKVKGVDLRIGDWLDTLDHRGARCIYGIWTGDIATPDLANAMVKSKAAGPESLVRTVMFGFGDHETIRCDVEYVVVDPDSQVTPCGDPVLQPEWPEQ